LYFESYWYFYCVNSHWNILIVFYLHFKG
jgi:hypothetical protein